jgi:hypothetical protein
MSGFNLSYTANVFILMILYPSNQSQSQSEIATNCNVTSTLIRRVRPGHFTTREIAPLPVFIGEEAG